MDFFHHAWLARQSLGSRPLQMAYGEAYDVVRTVHARRDRPEKAIDDLADDRRFAPAVHRLACLRGVNALTAFGLTVGVGDWERLNGNMNASFVGLVPLERSSG